LLLNEYKFGKDLELRALEIYTAQTWMQYERYRHTYARTGHKLFYSLSISMHA